MPIDLKPSTWLGAGYALDGTNHLIKLNTNDAARNATNTVSDTGAPADGDTVTVNGRVYTFKTTLTGAADEIHINGQDGSLTNLAAAINLTGTIGTDYGLGTVINAYVTASAVVSHSITLTAKMLGTAGNSLTLAKSGANLAVGGATFSGGVDKLLAQVTDALADPTTGDIRVVVFAIQEALYQAWLTQAGNQPAKMNIRRSAVQQPDGKLVFQYSTRFILSPPSGSYTVPNE
jgi:hypothetical protein